MFRRDKAKHTSNVNLHNAKDKPDDISQGGPEDANDKPGEVAQDDPETGDGQLSQEFPDFGVTLHSSVRSFEKPDDGPFNAAKAKFTESCTTLEDTVKKYYVKIGKDQDITESNTVISVDDVFRMMNFEPEDDKDSWKVKAVEKMKKALPFIKLCVGAASVVSEATGIMPAKIAANSVIMLVTLAEKSNGLDERVTTGLKEAQSMERFLYELDYAGLESLSTNFLVGAMEFSDSLICFLTKCLEYLLSNFFKKVTTAAVPNSELSDSENRLLEAINGFARAVSGEALLKALKDSEEKEYQKLVDYISDNSAEKSHRDTAAVRLEDTGDWFIQKSELKRWIKGDGAMSKIVCHGNPGVGKTFLSSKIIDHCLNKFAIKDAAPGKYVWVVWLYCQSSKKETQTLLSLVQSLIRQICNSAYKGDPQIRRKCFTVINGFEKAKPSHGIKDYLELLADLVNFPECERCHIVIDALDECKAVESTGLPAASIITELLDLKLPKVWLLVTSRSSIVAGAFETISIEPDKNDVKKYIGWRLDKSPPGFMSLLKETDGLRDKIIDDIASKYGAIFQLVRLMVDNILRLHTKGEIDKNLEKAPVGVDHVYMETIERIKDPSQGPSPLGLRAIDWIHAAKRPLSDKELRAALAMEKLAAISTDRCTIKEISSFTPTAEAIVTACMGLVELRTETETFGFSHATVKEYLDDNKNAYSPKVDQTISRVCIEYLSAVAKAHENRDSNTRVFYEGLFPYASWFWHEHINDNDDGKKLLGLCGLILEKCQSRAWHYWSHDHYKIPIRPQSKVEAVCGLRNRLLLKTLLSDAMKCRDDIERALYTVARRWPSEFPEMLTQFHNFSEFPSQTLVEAIAAAGEHGEKHMKQIINDYPSFQVTRSIIREAAKSTKPGELLRILCAQCTRERADAITTRRMGMALCCVMVTSTSMPIVTTGTLLFIWLMWRQTPTTLDLRNHPKILNEVAKNRQAPLKEISETLGWLRDNAQSPITSEIIYSIQFETWVDVGKFALESNVAISATDFLRNIGLKPHLQASYVDYANKEDRDGDHVVKFINQLLTELPKFAVTELSPELIYQIMRIPITGGGGWLTFDLCLLFDNGKATITPEGARCAARHFHRSTIIPFLKRGVISRDLSLEMLHEVRKCLDHESNPRKIKTFQDKFAHRLVYDEQEAAVLMCSSWNVRFYRHSGSYTGESETVAKGWTELEFNAIIRDFATSNGDELARFNLDSSTENLVQVTLRFLGLQDKPERLRDSFEFLCDQILTILKGQPMSNFVSTLAQEFSPNFKVLEPYSVMENIIGDATRHNSALCREDFDQAIAFLTLDYLVSMKQDSLDDLIRAAMYNVHYLPDVVQYELSQLCDDLTVFERILSHDLPNCSKLLDILLANNSSTWVPDHYHFEIAAASNSIETFIALQQYNTDLQTKKRTYRESVLEEAVRNQTDAGLDIVRMIRKAQENNDHFRPDSAIKLAMDNAKHGDDMVQELCAWRDLRRGEWDDIFATSDDELDF